MPLVFWRICRYWRFCKSSANLRLTLNLLKLLNFYAGADKNETESGKELPPFAAARY
jgi:hypothetical protein